MVSETKFPLSFFSKSFRRQKVKNGAEEIKCVSFSLRSCQFDIAKEKDRENGRVNLTDACVQMFQCNLIWLVNPQKQRMNRENGEKIICETRCLVGGTQFTLVLVWYCSLWQTLRTKDTSVHGMAYWIAKLFRFRNFSFGWKQSALKSYISSVCICNQFEHMRLCVMLVCWLRMRAHTRKSIFSETSSRLSGIIVTQIESKRT